MCVVCVRCLESAIHDGVGNIHDTSQRVRSHSNIHDTSQRVDMTHLNESGHTGSFVTPDATDASGVSLFVTPHMNS